MQTFSIEWDRDGHAKVELDITAVSSVTTPTRRQRPSWSLVATISFQTAAMVPLVAALS
jgi:hypothetical protein